MSRYSVYGGLKIAKNVLLVAIMLTFLANLYTFPTFTVNYDMMVDDVCDNEKCTAVNYSELMLFIMNNDVDKNVYNKLTYNCVDYSIDLIDDANSNGIYSGLCLLRFDDFYEGHSIVCFKTSDNGLVLIEPQSDLDVTNDVVYSNQYGSKEISSIKLYWN